MTDDLDDLIGRIQRAGEPEPPSAQLEITSADGLNTVWVTLKKQVQANIDTDAKLVQSFLQKDERLPKDAPALFEHFKGVGANLPKNIICLHYRHITENFHVGTLSNKHLGGWFNKYVHDAGFLNNATLPSSRISMAVNIAREFDIGMNKKVLFAYEWWRPNAGFSNVILEIIRDGFVRG